MKKYINQQDMRQANAIDVLSLIREHPGITRRQIANLTEFSWGAVSGITAHLLEERYIIEEKRESTGAGRIPLGLAVNGSEHFVLGLDVNSSGFRGVVINLKNEIVTEIARPADFSDADSLLAAITALAQDTANAAGEHSLLCVGVAMQGLVDSERGLSVSLPQCPGWKNVPLAEHLTAALKLPVTLEHDPNCLLYAWSRQAEHDDAILLRVDNGIGMSVMFGGRILSRPGMFEIGHQPAVRDGIPCTCGRSGCLEAYASMRGLAARAGISFAALTERADSGDEDARRLFSEAARYLAESVCGASALLDIKNIVLCGDMWQRAPHFLPMFFAEAAEYAKDQLPLFCRMTEHNAAFGAALIALERSLDQI
ncbi:MAG: ROK family protein [Ruminococcaceae bacterium]|nr:ROK family protein [Oscillospiraceae bacterium]